MTRRTSIGFQAVLLGFKLTASPAGSRRAMPKGVGKPEVPGVESLKRVVRGCHAAARNSGLGGVAAPLLFLNPTSRPNEDGSPGA